MKLDGCESTNVVVSKNLISKLHEIRIEKNFNDFDDTIYHLYASYRHNKAKEEYDKEYKNNAEIKPSIKEISNIELLVELLFRLDKKGYKINDETLGDIVTVLVLDKGNKHGA